MFISRVWWNRKEIKTSNILSNKQNSTNQKARQRKLLLCNCLIWKSTWRLKFFLSTGIVHMNVTITRIDSFSTVCKSNNSWKCINFLNLFLSLSFVFENIKTQYYQVLSIIELVVSHLVVSKCYHLLCLVLPLSHYTTYSINFLHIIGRKRF